MAGPTADFWEERYRGQQTGWDRGHASPQLIEWITSGLITPAHRIAVPGCGSGWEVAELARHGAEVIGIDYSQEAVTLSRERLAAAHLQAEIVCADVLHWQPDRPVDMIYEQTCLCALHPDHWVEYAQALHRWLIPGGHLLAMFMQRQTQEASTGFVVGPPYHCDIHAMRALFSGKRWEWCKPPYAQVPHPNGMYELGLVLRAL